MKPLKSIFTMFVVLVLSSCGGGSSDAVISRDPLLAGFWVGSNGVAPDNGYFLFENLSSFDGLGTFFFLDPVSNCFNSDGVDEIINVGGNRYRDSAMDVLRLLVQDGALTFDLLRNDGSPNPVFRRATGITPQDLPICTMDAASNANGIGFTDYFGLKQHE